MRILNLQDPAKQYSKFSVPGFRSGSFIKKIIAVMYYFSVVLFTILSIYQTVSADFYDARDIILAVVVELIILLILVVPIIIVGFSDYYDWHGIKLFLIIMVSWCILFTAANYVCTLFSDDFIKSTNPTKSSVEVLSDGVKKNQSDETKIDDDIIIDELNKQNSSSTK